MNKLVDQVENYMGFVQRFLLSPLSLKYILNLGAVALCLLDLVVMVGWLGHQPILIQLHPQFVPMQFNTALGFGLLGASLLSLNNNRKAIATGCAAMVFLLASLTLTEYIFDINLLIDELFIKHYITTATYYPGRMAPNTALNFCFSSVAIGLMIRRQLNEFRVFVVSILGSLVVGLGLVSVLGYLAQVETAYGWGKFTRMALHTSLGFILAGTLIIVTVRRFGLQIFRRLPVFFLPVTLGILSATTTIGFWQALRDSELSIRAQYNVPDNSFIPEVLLVSGGIFSVMLTIAVWYAEQFKRQLAKLKAAKNRIAQLNTRLEKLSYLDGLTGIPNRRLFDLTLEKEWGRAYREKVPIALVFIDIDCFKLYNDHYGHQEGDRCIQQIAEVLRSVARRTTDLAARYGGEEFVLLLPNTELWAAKKVAQRALEAVRELRIAHETSLVSSVVTFSAGVYACIPDDKQAIAAFVEQADEALYKAKKISRNCVATLPSA